MIPKVREWLDAQGFGLEMRAAAAFRAAGFDVRQSTHYIDAESSKAREIDVVARDPDVLGVVDIAFIVECKSSTKPWALLSSPDTVDGYSRLLAFGVLSEEARSVAADLLGDLLPQVGWLRKDGLVGYSLRQALSDADVAYAAAIGVAKACDSWIYRDVSAYAPPFRFAFPIIVVDSPILQCSLGTDGNIVIAEVEEAEFLFVARIPRYFGSCIRLVSLNRLPAFVQEAKATAGALRSAFKPSERSVGESWAERDPRPTPER